MSKDLVGVIGLGIMGSAMSTNLLRAGYQVMGHDVLPRRLERHRKAGGRIARNCRELARTCETIVTSLPSADALIEVASEMGKTRRSRNIVIDTSTLPISAKEQAREILAASGTVLLDCTLSGTGTQARTKDLVVYASGDPKTYRRIAPVLEAVSRAHYYVGEFGAGSRVKFIANLLVAIHNVAAAEAMVLARKSGLDLAMVYKVIADGAGSSRMFQVRGPMMVQGDYSDAAMKVQVFQKDMAIIGEFARNLDCPTPLFSASAPIYTAAMAMGWGVQDTGAVCAVLERMANCPRRHSVRKRSEK